MLHQGVEQPVAARRKNDDEDEGDEGCAGIVFVRLFRRRGAWFARCVHWIAICACAGEFLASKSADAVAQNFADGGIGAQPDFAFGDFSHVMRQGDAELLRGSHKRPLRNQHSGRRD